MDDASSSPQAERAAHATPGPAEDASVSKLTTGIAFDTISRAPSPGLPMSKKRELDQRRDGGQNDRRYRPRTFSYFELLPFPVEAESERDEALEGILKQLYISIAAEDFSPGALFWSRQLQNWLHLKFEMKRELRARLTKLYYHLAFAPGIDSAVSDRFVRMVVTLTRKYHYLKPGEDLALDWRPLWKEFKMLVLPGEVGVNQTSRRRPHRQIWKLCLHAQAFFDPRDRKEMLEEFLPFFSTSDLSNAYIVVGLINALLPTDPAPKGTPQSLPQDFLPTFFHLWSLVSRSRAFDTYFIDLFCRLARGFLPCDYVPFSAHGIFTKEQSDVVFTAILRLTDIPVGQANSPYTTLDLASGLGSYMEKDKKKHPVAYLVSRWIVNSLSPLCLESEDSIMASLEGLIESIDTFFHPSNQGSWTTMLGQLTHYLVDMFVLRWNREQSGELDIPQERRITPELKKRFVLCLRDVTFMGLFSKSSRVAYCYYSALHGLAYLEPGLILPGALQRFYPSLQGLVEVHRTTSSLNGLQMIANTMSKEKGYRCHITALLALALPGIDANDLNKTQYTLNFFQSVAYSIPFVSLVKEDDQVHDTNLAMQWVQGEMDRMEREGQDVKMDYANELSDEDEKNILRSSTAGFGEFILALLGKVFTLLENLPDASHLRGGTPEDNVINALPAALSPLFASLSPELFDMALDKIATFVSTHVVHQARDAMAWILNALCKVNPQKTLKAFIPMLIANIRNEIDYNHAASDRSSGTDYLPRDRALVWHVTMLGMTVVHVGGEVLNYRKELFAIAEYMQTKCRGLPTIHISNFVHHLLLNLTRTYPIDHALYEPSVMERGPNVEDWGRTVPPTELSIRWHRPQPAEIQFAQELFEWLTQSAVKKLDVLMNVDSQLYGKGKNKEWSDEVVRVLQLIRLVISGMASLFDPRRASEQQGEEANGVEVERDGDGDVLMEDNDPLAEVVEDEEMRPQYRYEDGYFLQSPEFSQGGDQSIYNRIHELREDIGRLLSRTHSFLSKNQEDDVTCFTALYAAYRTWITDVGIERSAHPLERHLRLYNADIMAFKISGLRKNYPRPLLIKRADAYQLHRAKHNASTRQKSALDKQLLLDLAESCLSPYADVRRVAQSSQDSSLKVLIGGRPLVIPVVLKRFAQAIADDDHDRIKGGMYTLFFTSLIKTLVKDWRFAPDAVRLYIETAGIDKASIQGLGTNALLPMLDFGQLFDRLVIVDKDLVDSIKPSSDCSDIITERHDFIVKRGKRVEKLKGELGLELTLKAKEAHWKIASRCAFVANNLCLRFVTLVPPQFVDLVVRGTIDPHPSLRTAFLSAFTAIFTTIDGRASYDHDYRNFLLGNEVGEKKLVVDVPKGDAAFTDKFLQAFEQPEGAEYMVDSDHPGWLVWGKNFNALRARPKPFLNYDELENSVREQIGKLLDKAWFAQLFEYMKQEPRDANTDRFRMPNVYLMMHAFDLIHYDKAAATFEDIKDLVKDVFGDGSDKHQHRATAEILGALLAGSMENPPDNRNKVWGFAAPMMLDIITDGLTPENQFYWVTCLHLIADSKDPRRYHEFVTSLSSFRLDMGSNAAFKDSLRVLLVESLITDGGWHFRNVEPILKDFMDHLDHPYKSVREAIGRSIATIYRTRYHESFENVDALLGKNKAESSIGIRPYQPTEAFRDTVLDVFKRLEEWRHERTPGQHTPSSYTSGSKTVLMWLDVTLSSQECTQLVPFFPDSFMPELLHMMDVKEDPELMRLAYHVYRHLPNIQFRAGEDAAFIESLIRIGRSAASWHQRLRALINLQVIYFRRIFLTAPATRDLVFEAVSDMLTDPQLEVRTCASSTLAGMIRCSPRRIRDPAIAKLKDQFETALRNNPMPPREMRRTGASGGGSGTETPVDVQKQIRHRHAAVLGLSALIEAFPYATPPPKWMPEVLATLATRAANDPGVVGKATKSILSEFKKTRQDNWSVDQKYFTQEQLEDLEGVLWKSYFA